MKKLKLNLKPNMDGLTSSLKTVTTKQGAYSIAAIVIVLIIAVVVNLIGGKLPASVKEIDISSNKVYEISDTSREMLLELEEDIVITVIAEVNSVDDRLKTFLEKYTALSEHLKLEFVDPVAHPSALTEYETETNTVIVSCEKTEMSTQIPIDDILVADYSYYYYTGSADITAFDGDGQLTAAINHVKGSEKKKLYCLTDHGEEDLGTTLSGLMTKAGISTEEYSLVMKDKIPDDCDLILINGLASDLQKSEVKRLNAYIKAGGDVVILLSENCPDEGNYVDFLKDYGIHLETGYVADMQRNYQGNYYYIFPNVNTYDEVFTDGLTSGLILMGNSKGFTLDEETEEVYPVSILETSEDGYVVSESEEKQGVYAVGVVSTYTRKVEGEYETDAEEENSEDTDDDTTAETETIEGTLTVYGSNTLINDNVTSGFSGLDNNTLFMNSVTDAIGDIDNLAIEAKSLQVQYNTPQYGGFISFMIIFVIPIAIVIVGFVFWMRRRKA